jgi:UDP-2,3-diacylglucosamine pyrophosphatase LpxH
MFYVIADTLLKVALNNNITVLHGDQFYWCLTTLSTICQVLRITWSPVLFVFNDTFNNVSGIK